MPSKAEPIAIAISDLHLSLQRPACRADKDWMAVQAHYLKQVGKASRQMDVPILCGGDVIDRWNPVPELIHFAMLKLPTMFAVPGQHDLPNHSMWEIHRSGYGVLTLAGKTLNVANGQSTTIHSKFKDGKIHYVYGFGWNEEITQPSENPKGLNVALIHRYCWADGKGYPGAPESNHVNAYTKQLRGYDIAIFGDCHTRFSAQCGNCTIINPGTFIRRKSDEIKHKPAYAVIYSDGSFEWVKLDTSIDEFQPEAIAQKEMPVDVKGFIDELRNLGEQGLDFREAVKQHLRKDDLPSQVKQMIIEALG